MCWKITCRSAPQREEILRQHIQSGRLLIGPWYILPDEFLVSPEATIRNLLEGDRITRLFGPKMRVGYIPDPFGHIGQMPQILRGFGIETACLMRGLADEPCELWWQSPDGSRVLMAYLRDSYGNAAGILNAGVEGFAEITVSLRDALAPHSASNHLLLMHGTDHMEPQPDTSVAIASAEGRLDGDQIIHSTLPAYFAALQSDVSLDQLPVVRGELRASRRHPSAAGCPFHPHVDQAAQPCLRDSAGKMGRTLQRLGGLAAARPPAGTTPAGSFCRDFTRPGGC